MILTIAPNGPDFAARGGRALLGGQKPGTTDRMVVPAAEGSPGVMVICNDCGTVSNVEVPDVLAGLHRSLAAEGFAEARQTIEVHGRCGGCAGDQP